MRLSAVLPGIEVDVVDPAKKRMCQSPGAKHIGGVVAELPLGM